MTNVEMCIQLGCVNARVGAPTAYSMDGLPQERAQCLVEYLLYGLGIGLYLPAVIGAAIESDLNEIPGVGVFHGAKIKIMLLLCTTEPVTLTSFTPLGCFRA